MPTCTSIVEQRTVALDSNQIATIRKALQIGLTCYGEIEERINAIGLHETNGDDLPNDVRVLHPTGSRDVVSVFAAALRYLETN